MVSNQKEAMERFMFKYYNNKPIKNNYNIPGTISEIRVSDPDPDPH